MSDLPKIKLQLTTFDKSIEFISWIGMALIWILTFSNYSTLPEIIPVHYNGAGEADRFGNKTQILILPIVSTVLFMGLTYLNRFPHIFNYPTELTKENALHQYNNATRMIRFLKLAIIIIFGLIVFKTIQNAHGNVEGLGIWFLPLTIGLILIPMIYYILKSIEQKLKKKKS
ncbi:DUF1648 domain-containing protein [Antarcticibacterium flavum]|uniref:DUF1648 domain-containing protein n=2 Tax=Flavobacteriaceae TaxID=49546 RepID=A0A5B7X8F1_9FLAO|nr:DUF1648 domain-containing protein [Antarcticibacterium sp. W02-3]MCM4159143.1 hypothetical protein [Antarcticibacterium sp. W02-3]QCY71405.1 DUF1648 domain-containing protein [Antarcticibacterium flavum]